MFLSRTLVPTIKEPPADAVCESQRLLVRAGYVRRLAGGGWALLPLGVRVLSRIEGLARETMAQLGALEIALPAGIGEPADAAVVDLARREIRSHREMPMRLFQIGRKVERREGKQIGLLRSREYVSLDLWSLDVDEAAAARSIAAIEEGFTRFLERIGLRGQRALADGGLTGPTTGFALAVSGEAADDVLLTCDACDHAASATVASARPPPIAPPTEERRKVHTPGARSIGEVSAFLARPPEKFLKSLVYAAVTPSGERDVVLAVVRGDHDLNETLLARALGVAPENVTLATDTEVEVATGAKVGFAGPVGFTGRIVVDRAAAAVSDAVVGANETDHHLTGVSRVRDWEGEVVDLRRVFGGEPCPQCASGTLAAAPSIEGGRIGTGSTRAAAIASALYTDEKQEKRPIAIGSHHLGLGRLLAAIVELHRDADGIRWPAAVAPFGIHLVTIGREDAVVAAGARIHDALVARGIDVLWDDRDERPGVKFKDADLLGVPLRVTVGAKVLAGGNVELKARSGAPTPDGTRKEAEIVAIEGLESVLESRLAALEDRPTWGAG